MTTKKSPSVAMTEFLNSIPDEFRPSDIYPDVLAAASRLDAATPEKAAQDAAVILQLLGSAAFFGVVAPYTAPIFPGDHAMHLNSGTEWYYLICNLEIQGPGGPGRIGVFIDFARNRAVSEAIQKRSGWTDEDAQVAYSLATVVVDAPDCKCVVRRRSNAYWPIKDPGSLTFSKPGEPFLLRFGPDVMQSPNAAVLPLTVRVDDGSNMQIELTVTSQLSAERAFFLQGIDGLVPPRDPGMYYSWPQVSVSGRLTVQGNSYDVAGKGWIDHQLMMKTPERPPEIPIAPGKLFQGWSWCGVNLSNGNALTAAAFQFGDKINGHPLVVEGFHVVRTSDGWEPQPITIGALDLEHFMPMAHGVSMPTGWRWQVDQIEPGPRWEKINLRATAWNRRCDFESDNLLVLGETPVDLHYLVGGKFAGTGYCESFGFEPLESFERRALAFLKTPTVPQGGSGVFDTLLRFMKIRS